MTAVKKSSPEEIRKEQIREIIDSLTEKYENVEADDLRQLIIQGIEEHDLKIRTAGNVIRSVLSAIYREQEVFTRLEIPEMTTAAAKEFYQVTIEQLHPAGQNIFLG